MASWPSVQAEAGLGEIDGDHAEAPLGEQLGRGPADARRGAGDHHCLRAAPWNPPARRSWGPCALTVRGLVLPVTGQARRIGSRRTLHRVTNRRVSDRFADPPMLEASASRGGCMAVKGARIDAYLVCGGKYHDFDFVRLELLKLLAEDGHVRVKVAQDFADTDTIAAADFLVTYTCDVRPTEAAGPRPEVVGRGRRAVVRAPCHELVLRSAGQARCGPVRHARTPTRRSSRRSAASSSPTRRSAPTPSPCRPAPSTTPWWTASSRSMPARPRSCTSAATTPRSSRCSRPAGPGRPRAS